MKPWIVSSRAAEMRSARCRAGSCVSSVRIEGGVVVVVTVSTKVSDYAAVSLPLEGMSSLLGTETVARGMYKAARTSGIDLVVWKVFFRRA